MADGKTNGAAEAITALRRLVAVGRSAFVIYDLEVTTWEGTLARRWGGPNEFPEIVQIGAVKLAGGSDHAELESFNWLVRPLRNPVLSRYFIDLTGITQEAVDTKGVTFPEALQAFKRFVAGCGAFSNGGDDLWLAANCTLHGLANPFQPADLVNIGPYLGQVLDGSSHVDSNELPTLVGSINPGRSHDALADARAIATAVRHLLATPAGAAQSL